MGAVRLGSYVACMTCGLKHYKQRWVLLRTKFHFCSPVCRGAAQRGKARGRYA